jgi:putative ATP-binding cassette transporter
MKRLKIIEFFHREYEGPKGTILLMSIIGGLAFPVMVYVVTQAAMMATNTGASDDFRLFFLFIIVCSAVIVTKRYVLMQTTRMAESVVRKVRIRLIDKLRRTELQFLERIGKGDIYARLTQDTDLISFTASDVIYVFDGIFSAVGLFLYTAFVSMAAFAFTMVFLAVLFTAYFFNYLQIRDTLNVARAKEADFFDALNDTISGFKEIKINRKMNDDLFRDTEALSRETEWLKTKAEFKNNNNIIFSFILYEGLLGVVVFLVPLFSGPHSQTVIQLVAMMLFVYGTLNGISRGMPVVITTNVAVENLDRLEARLDSIGSFSEMEEPARCGDFNEITMESVSFQYVDDKGEPLFLAGPIDLTIRQGDVLFIVGGNGSGKSTVLKLLTGLYFPLTGGRILLDGQAVTRAAYQGYRELFSTIFTDFHLFRKLYGIESLDVNRVKRLLAEMDLHAKTDYEKDHFTTIDLSTGQRKRLAYIAALLEDKPIFVFDEWAADQDPEYRRHFYERFLEDLRKMNKTVIAVTHDERFFDRADRIIKMEEGKVVEVIK